jgi:pimeloyl-ACP methyl ester carboxylesterase
MSAKMHLTALFLIFIATSACAAPCETDDFETRVTGLSQCLLMRRYGPTDPTVLIVWLHGDVSSGGPANYHFRLAQKTAEDLSASNVMSVALVRLGYPDGTGAESTVSLLHGGRSDHYTQENIAEVGAVIEKLRAKCRPKSVVIVGHSGGAATAAVLLGMKPQLADAAVLVSCPCDLVSWRRERSRREWSRSENPTRWAEKISAATRVIAVTGSRDDNTPPNLATTYVELLRSRGIDAIFQAAAEATHNSAVESVEVHDAIAKLALH